MSHPRKKGGERKDKKNERMRGSVEARKETATEHPTTDQADVVTFKQGGPSDTSVSPEVRHRQVHPL